MSSVTDGGRLHIWKLDVNTMNKQSRTANKGLSSSLEGWV